MQSPALVVPAEGCPTLTNMLVILVGGIPIAMPTVLSVTLALGAAKLAEQGAIVARMSAVEEMAGMDILCSDKTGANSGKAARSRGRSAPCKPEADMCGRLHVAVVECCRAGRCSAARTRPRLQRGPLTALRGAIVQAR
jgi:hypothetical protein